ncbi:MAG: hypothetical protein ACSLFQ_13800 [Thermoanaerobaculia bacterium]
MHVRRRAEAIRQLDEWESGAASDVESDVYARQRGMLEQEQAEHCGPERQLIVRGYGGSGGQIDFAVQVVELVHAAS